MTNEEIVRKEAGARVSQAERLGVRNGIEPYVKHITDGSLRLFKPEDKALFLNEAIQRVNNALDAHRVICKAGAHCQVDIKFQKALFYLQQEVDALPKSSIKPAAVIALPSRQELPDFSPAHLHPTVQTTASSLWASCHYRQAVLDACIALDKTVQIKAQQPASLTGKTLMTTVFSASQPLIRLSQDTNEQLGFMNLYQGSAQAIRNHYAHNLTEIPADRALEWLGFISALFYKLDEAQPTNTPPTAS